jgi:hypothetical protein
MKDPINFPPNLKICNYVYQVLQNRGSNLLHPYPDPLPDRLHITHGQESLVWQLQVSAAMFRTASPARSNGRFNHDRTNGLKTIQMTSSHTPVTWRKTSGLEEVGHGNDGKECQLYFTSVRPGKEEYNGM